MIARRLRRALVLAAHGAGDESAGNAAVRDLARRLSGLPQFDETRVAFNMGAPRFADVLQTISAEHVTVVPLMTSDGYFRRVVLPRELSKSPPRGGVEVRITPPIGAHALLQDWARGRLTQALRRFSLSPQATCALIVGHGAARCDGSGDTTYALRDAVEERGLCAAVRAAFLDEPPFVQDAPACISQPNVVVIPFFVGGSEHVDVDIPTQLGAAPLPTPFCWHALRPVAPAARRIRQFVFTPPLGRDPVLETIVADLASDEGLRHEQGRQPQDAARPKERSR